MIAPFYSQHWNLSNWQKLGFQGEDDARYWQESSCGILCLKMAIDSFRPDLVHNRIIDYTKLGKEIGAYEHNTGWSHGGLVKLAKSFGVEAINKEHLTLSDLKKYINQGYLPIVSIKWAFINSKSLKEKILFWKKYGGHLALILSYNEQGFYVHHTSKILEQNWQNRLVSFDKFSNAFTGRAVLVNVASSAQS